MPLMDKKIPVAILGATGTVGQRFIQLLTDHPWFEITAVAGSERSQGKIYRDAVNWLLPDDLPNTIGDMVIQPLKPDLPARIVFSALPTQAALELEPLFAAAGYAVCSNAAAFRQTHDIPLLIPEVNGCHSSLIEQQRAERGWEGFIVTSPNCSTTGIALPLKPLADAFGLKAVFATTLQAISGAGYPGISAFDISNNVIPYIKGEEEKIESETQILLGQTTKEGKQPHPVVISAQTNRVNVINGHTASISVQLKKPTRIEELNEVWESFNAQAAQQILPSSPNKILTTISGMSRPQPSLDINRDSGMTVSIGQVRPCPIFDYKMTTLVHNTIRGAAGGAILNAEYLVTQGFIS